MKKLIKQNNFQFFVIKKKLPSLNDILRASSSWSPRKKQSSAAYARMKRECDRDIVASLIKYNVKPVDSFHLKIIWVEKNRRRDPDNIASAIKFILDAMQKRKIILNDGWKHNLGWENSFVVGKNHKIIVKIYEGPMR